MTESEPEESDEEKSGPTYTLDVNGRRYALSEEFRQAIQSRARGEYRENHMFSCWWRVADATDADDESTIHEEGDPILVIETEGPTVPWDSLDELEVEMVEETEQPDSGGSSSDTDRNDIDSGSGMKSVPPEDVKDDDEEDEEQEIGRSHFALTPQHFEDVPQPDGEEEDKLPPKPVDMGDDPSLVWWIPRNPDSVERWATGEAIIPTHSWVEWNVQARADEFRMTPDGEKKATSHDHFESLCKTYGCEKVGEYKVTQDVPPRQQDDMSESAKQKRDQFENGKYGGDNWQI